jgi:uncharacterized membrane protein YhaH (DUF805 family)
MNYIIDAVTTNYWNYKGRSSRKSFWMMFLTAIALQVVSGIGAGLANSGDTTASLASLPINLFVIVVALFLLIPLFFSAMRRCHDVNYSYWYTLIPLFNVYLFALMMFARGTVGANNYGEDPTDTPNGITNPDATATPLTPLAATPQN